MSIDDLKRDLENLKTMRDAIRKSWQLKQVDDSTYIRISSSYERQIANKIAEIRGR